MNHKDSMTLALLTGPSARQQEARETMMLANMALVTGAAVVAWLLAILASVPIE